MHSPTREQDAACEDLSLLHDSVMVLPPAVEDGPVSVFLLARRPVATMAVGAVTITAEGRIERHAR